MPATTTPVVMLQTWHDLAFLHWPIEPAQLSSFVPRPLELDTYDNAAWLGIVPFRMSGVRLRFFPPIPTASAFPELNVRTYVRHRDRPGVLFLSLDAASALAVAGARAAFHLPYFRAAMRCERNGGWIEYASRRTHRGAPEAELRCRYRPIGAARAATPGSLEHFLVERYSLFTALRDGRLVRGDVAHPPYPLQPAEVLLERNSMARAHGLALPDRPPLAHFALRQQVDIGRPRLLRDGSAP